MTALREHRGWVALLLVVGVVAITGAVFLPLPAPPPPAGPAVGPAATPAAGAAPRGPQGGPGPDVLVGSDGPDLIHGLLGDDRIDGRGGPDTLHGGKGNDVIAGGDGDDWISGDLGDDTLSGGRGADTFHFAANCGNDRITDFNAGEGDRIALEPGVAYAARQEGADTVVEIAGGRIVLVGVNFLSLPGGWIDAA